MARASVSGVQSSWMPSMWTPRRASQQAAGRRPVMTKPQAVARRQAWRLLTGHRPQSALVSVWRKTQRKAARVVPDGFQMECVLHVGLAAGLRSCVFHAGSCCWGICGIGACGMSSQS